MRRPLLGLGGLAYRVGLLTLPGRFRREWRDPMAGLFDRRGAEAFDAHGVAGLFGWWLRAGRDLARTWMREWGEAMAGGTTGIEAGFRETERSLRRYLRTPTWTGAALLTLIVGVGAMTGMVSIVWDSLVRPLPFQEPDRLVDLTAEPADGSEPRRFSLSLLEAWQDAGAGDLALAGYAPTQLPLDFGRGPEYVQGAYATGDLMELLGVRPLAGRVFDPADGREGGTTVMVISESLWRTEFGGDPGVAGRTQGSREIPIVGVVGRELGALLPDARFWLSTATFPRSPNVTVLSAVGRLPDGLDLEAAKARLAGVRVVDGNGRAFSGSAAPLRDMLVRDVRTALLVFLTVVSGLLLIGVVNLANLFLARAVTLDDDRAIRRALGASRGRLLAAAVIDGAVLGLVGGLGGLLLGMWIRRIVTAASPASIPGFGDGGIGPVETGASLGIAIGLCVILTATTLLRGGTESGPAGARGVAGTRPVRRVQRGLTVVQVAATFVVLVSSALLARTFVRLATVETGFDVEGVAGLRFSLPEASYPDTTAWRTFTLRIVDEIGGIPGVSVASVVDRPLLAAVARARVEAEGSAEPDEAPMSVMLSARPSFLDAMGIPLLRGRALGAGDTEDAPPVAVVSESFARLHFPEGGDLGRRFRLGTGPWTEVVGVIPDLRPVGPAGEAESTFIRPTGQAGAWSHFVSVVFRAEGDPAEVLPIARERLRQLEPGAAVYEMGPYADWLAASPVFAETRFRALVVGLLGGVALVLALVGVYGVTAYSVRRRTRELGIRLALGGGERRVVAHVLGEGVRLAATGIVLGGAVAWLAVERLAVMLEGMPARDPLVFAVVAGTLTAVAVLACVRPALAAGRVAPAESLRES